VTLVLHATSFQLPYDKSIIRTMKNTGNPLMMTFMLLFF
jgi:hypothetical protein